LTVRVSHNELSRFVKEAFMAVGTPEEYANIVADHLVLANLRGVDSHGVIRLPNYIRGIMEGYINPKPQIKIIKDSPWLTLLDGDRGIGHAVAAKATEIAINKAKNLGLGVIGIRNIRHIGMLAYYVLKIVNNNMLGFVAVNASPAIGLPGFKKPITGNNPLAMGFPVKNGEPIVLDMALSVVARGKIMVALKRGERIPEGWALSKDGKPTTDPKEAYEGILLPIGGYKGLGLAIVMDMLCGILVGGGKYSLKVQRVWWFDQGGVLIVALKLDNFMTYEEYFSIVNEYIKTLKSMPTSEGTEVVLPGEPELRIFNERIQKGIPIDDEVFKEFKLLAEKLGIRPLTALT